ncbi:MAG TPA: PKD domain-containing protein [Chloroflexota bacterium]|nr:PKD domain-containing protein [Chloroflexota bacterium]
MSKPVSRTVVKVFTAVTLLLLASFATTNASSTPRGSQAIRQQTPALAPEVVTVTATKTDSLFTDVNGNTLVDPGDTLEYTIVVGNSGDEDALNTLFTDITDDTEVTVVAGSLRATPIGRNDAYNVIGNTHITHAAGAGLLANDLDPDGGAITASCSPCTTANGAAVTLNTDGSFTYNPPVGFTGSDTFTYTVTDNHGLTDTGTVTFTVANRIWWVDSDAAAGDGRALTPFQTISAAQSASGANDIVFVYERGASYTGGFVMDNGERLCGHGSSLQTCSGITPPTGTTFPTVSTNPTIINAGGAGITLAQNNTIYGITVGSTTASGITGANFGTLTAQNVTINTGDGGLSLNTGTANVTFNSITSTGGTNNITLTTVAGTLNLGSGALSGGSSHAFNVSGGTATINYAGTISNSTAEAINIQSKTGGTVNLSGAVNSTGTGINLINNTGATINLSGSLTISAGTNEAFTATGGGTLSVTGAANTVSTTTGTAVNMRNITIGASGVTFRSVSANGGANGIYLESNTGGTFTVSGTGSAGSGGTIQNMTGANGSTAGIGVYINNTGNVSLNWMQLNGFSNFAIRGITASNVTLANSVVSGTSGDSAADDEGAISFTNLTGTFTFTNNTVSGGHEDNVRIVNNTGTLNATVSGSTIRDNTAVSPGNNGLWFQADGTANITALVTTSNFLRNRANGIQAITNDAGVMDITVGTLGVAGSGGTFQDNNIGVNIAHNSSGTLNFDVQETTIQPVALITGASPININLGSLGNQMSGTVHNNFIRNANSATGPGIRIIGNGAGTLTILVNNNNIAQIGNRGIEIIARDGSNRINATVTNNTVALTDPLSGDGIRADAGAVSTDATTICANFSGNTSTTIGGLFGIRVRQRFAGTTYFLQGYGGSATDMTAVQSFLSANNNGATTLADFGGSGFQNQACPTPSFAFSEDAVITPTTLDDIQELDDLTGDAPILPLLTSDTEPKDETNPKQAAHSPGKVATSAAFAAAFAPETPEATTTVGPFTLPPQESTTITFRVVVNDPFPPAQNPICNQAVISGSNFSNVLSDDPDVAGGSDPTCTTVQIIADLALTKTDGDVTAVPGDAIAYTLTYTNTGPSESPAVVITETVPAHATFNAGASTAGWVCTPDNNAGSVCTLAVGAVPVGSGTTVFAATVINPVPAGVTQVSNTATIGDSQATDPDLADNDGSDTTPITAQPDYSISKSDGATTGIPGGTVAYTLSYVNNGNQDGTGVVLNETVPANSSFNPGASTAGWVCTPNNNAGSACTLTVGSLAGGGGSGSATFAVTVINPVPAGVTQISNTAAIADDGANGADPTPGNNSSSDTTPLNAQPDYSITKSDGGITSTPGGTIAYTLSYANNGNQGGTSVVLNETVPANSSFNPGASTAGWACTPNNNAGSSCTLAVGGLAGGGASGSATFAVTVVNPIPAGVSQISNTATITDDGANGADPTPGNNSSSDTTPITAQPDYSIGKSDGGATGTPGGTVAYTLSYANNGNQGGTGVVLNETVPANSSFNPGASTAGWSCTPNNNAGSTCTLTVGSLAGGGGSGSATFAVTVINPVPAGVTQISNTATIADDGTNGADPTPGNNSSSDTTPINAAPDMQITKSDSDIAFLPGDFITYTLTYQNVGDQDATGVALTDTVPADTTFIPVASSAGWSCVPDNNAGSLCTLSIGAVSGGGGGTAVFTVQVDDPAPGVTLITNTAGVADDGSNGADPNPADNTGTDTTPIANLPPTLTNVVITSPLNENGVATLSGDISDPDVDDVFTLTVDWGDGSTPDTFNYPAGTTSFSETHQYLDDNPTGTPSDNNTVSLSLSDGTNVVNASTAVTVNNIAPTLSGVSATNANENGSVTLNGSISDPGTQDTFTLVVDWGDGNSDTYNYPAGATSFSETHQYLDDNPTGTPADNYTISLTLTDDDTGSDSDSAATTISNVAPTLSNVAVTANVDEGGSATLSGNISDPGTQDTFTLVVDWGDGNSDTFNYPAGTTSFSETHQYLDDDPTGTPSDNVTISLTLTDDDTGSDSETAVLTVHNIAPDLFNLAATPLIISETNTITLTGNIADPGVLDTFTLEVDWADGNGETVNYPAGTTAFTLTHTYQDDALIALRAPEADFTIEVTLTDDDTGSDSDSVTVTVENLPPTLSGVTISSPVDEGSAATLSGSISDPSPADTFTLLVDWGDGNSDTFNYGAGATGFSETHIYVDDDPTGTPSDVYTVTLTLTDDNGGSDMGTTAVTVNNVAPQLGNVAATAVSENDFTTLSGDITDPGTADTFTLVVDWGDGITETFSYGAGTTSFSETHQYLDDDPSGTPADDYTITLTLTDDDTGSDADSTTVTVSNVAPALSNLTATDVDENGVATLSGGITDPGTLDTFTVVVDWGDGSSDTYNHAAGTTNFSETHQYLDDDPSGTPADEYTVTVTISDDDTGMGSDTAVLTVSNLAPDLFNIAATPLNIDENNTITVTGQISDVGTLDSFSLVIDWADGITETFNYPAGTTSFLATHLYEDDALQQLRAPLADFDIVLTLMDDDTGSDSETITVQVDNVAPSLDNVSISDPINEGDTAVLTGSIIEVSPADTFTLTVAWGDGVVDSFAYGAGATGFSESHTYADDNPTGTPADVYTVTLTLVDDNGGTAVHITSLTVHNVAPVVDAGADMAVNTGTAVTFNGSFSDIGLEDTHTIEWDFGDGNSTSGTLTPTYTYSTAGVYTATLTVTDDDTGVASDHVVVTVTGSTIFLPIILNNSGAAPGPDLVVSSLTAVGSNITVVVSNQGDTAVTDDFWVDVYIDPDPVPTMVNQTWQLIAAQGLVWGVTDVTLNPGQSLTLTINDGYYRADLSEFTGPLPTGTPVYAQVDSANTNTTYGNVLESHESGGGVYNNITGTIAQ